MGIDQPTDHENMAGQEAEIPRNEVVLELADRVAGAISRAAENITHLKISLIERHGQLEVDEALWLQELEQAVLTARAYAYGLKRCETPRLPGVQLTSSLDHIDVENYRKQIGLDKE